MTDYNLRQINETPNVETAFLWDFENMNVKLKIEDGVFAVHDEYILLFVSCTDGKGFKQKDNYKWEWKSGEKHNLMLQFWQKSREETDYKTKEKKTIAPSDIELYMGWIADGFENIHFSGSLSLNHTSALKMCYSGVGDDGNPIGEQIRDMMSNTMANLTIIETPSETIWTPELMASLVPKSYTKKSSSYGGSKGQTEAERIKDRVEWFLEKYAEITELGMSDVTLKAIASAQFLEEAQYKERAGLAERLIRLMG